MIAKEIALIVPTIRENCFTDFYKRWNDIGLFDHVDLFVMEDNPTKTFKVFDGSKNNIVHLCWKNIRDGLGEDEWIIPRRSDTVRSFAYWYAHSCGYRYIMTLDDDCYPMDHIYDGKGFVEQHKKYLNGGRTRWFNTLDCVKPRGIPFYNLGERNDTIVNHGLWTNVIDYDAPTQLVNPVEEKFAYDNKIVPHGSYFPMCGMNVMWKAEYTVLMYHLLMGQQLKPKVTPEDFELKPYTTLKKLPFDRFGDIWCGIFMKKCADILGKTVSTGIPYIRHERASNPFTNLKKEANGLEVNEKLWEYVDSFDHPGIVEGYIEANTIYMHLGKHITKYDEFPEYTDYFKKLGKAMQIWAGLFKGVGSE